ncbi:MAG: phosphopyruvate hydratase [Thermoplasmata archaeon]|nr:MAG: phosphopyruvate hydratase [Thermoplasmata archaeon]
MASITDIIGRQILDSRGNPTVEVELKFELEQREQMVRASVPSGASTGALEAIELRDGSGPFRGKGVTKALEKIQNVLKPKLIGQDCTNQKAIDDIMLGLDGTENKGELGANAILGISAAVARAGAVSKGVTLYEHLGSISNSKPEKLPIPVMNIINGGAHAGNNLDFQEFMIIPSGAASYSEAVQIGVETYAELKGILGKKFGPNATNIGDEGGFAPPLNDVEEPFKLILEALTELGYEKKVKLGIDVAASQFYKDKKYIINKKELDYSELLEFYKNLASTYPIVSIEDPFDEEDWEGFTAMTKELGNKIQIVGDDLFVTNVKRIKIGLEKGACNSVLLKVNQIGSVSEAIGAALYAFENDYTIMVSHRSGETEDSFIADLAVSLNCGQIKSGAPARSDRTAKYNQLLRIEEQLGSNAKYGDVRYLSG